MKNKSIDIIKILSKPININILALLSTGPKYPRILAGLLGKSEAFVVRNLKDLEQANLVESYWIRIGEKNVKMYRLKTKNITISFSTGNVKVVMSDGSERYLLSTRYSDPIPDPSPFVNRIREIELLKKTFGVSFVWGPMGVGKSSLASIIAKIYEGKTLWINSNELTLLDEIIRRLCLFFADQGEKDLLKTFEAGARPGRLAPLVAEALNRLEGMVVLDDFHKIAEKDPIYEFLYSLDKLLVKGKLLVLSREPPEIVPEKGVLLPLSGLSFEDTKALLKLIGVELDEETYRWVYEATMGYPAMIVALGKLVSAGFNPKEVVERGVLDGIIGKILKTLDAYEYESLVAASVFLSTPTIKEVESIARIGGVDIYLRKLARKGIIQIIGDSVIIHDALKSFIERNESKKTKRYHKALAQILLDQMSGESVFRAFYHLFKAEDYVAALEVIEEARKMNLAIPENYHMLYREILDSIPYAKLPSHYRLLLVYNRAMAMDGKESITLLENLLSESQLAEDKIVYLRALVGLAFKLFKMGDDKYLEYLDKAFFAAENWADPLDSRFFVTLIWLLHKAGNIRKAEKVATRYLSLASSYHEKAYAHHFLAIIYETCGKLELALRHIDEAISNYLKTPILYNLAVAYNDKGYILYNLGEHDQALIFLEKAYKTADIASYSYVKASSLIDMAEVYVSLPDPEKTSERINYVEKNFSEILDREPSLKGRILFVKARLSTLQGNLGEADYYFTIAASKLEKTHKYHYARCLLFHSFLSATMDKKKACRLAQKACQIYTKFENKSLMEKALNVINETC